LLAAFATHLISDAAAAKVDDHASTLLLAFMHHRMSGQQSQQQQATFDGAKGARSVSQVASLNQQLTPATCSLALVL
jgi:hypothetical protein